MVSWKVVAAIPSSPFILSRHVASIASVGRHTRSVSKSSFVGVMAMGSVSGSDDGESPVQRRNATTSRRKKSAAQIEFLERLYAENKYPSEEVRAKLSEQLGLSEKQMQIWFTHRRHKDRKEGVEDVKLTFYAMRHKGGEAHLDFMEELNSGKRMGAGLLGMDDTPPSSAYLQPSYSGGDISTGHQVRFERKTDSESEHSGLGQADEPLPFNNGLKLPMKRGSLGNRKDIIPKRPMTVPPRPKVQPRDLERAAISAVENQLGGTIRTDGPHLGLEFDSLPPGAWMQVPQMTAAPSHGRVDIGMQERFRRIQSIGTY